MECLFQPMIIEIHSFKRDDVRWAARGGEFCLKEDTIIVSEALEV